MFKLNNRSVIAVLLIALVPRLALMLAVLIQNPDGIWVYDSYGYWQIGYNLVTHGSYSMSHEGTLLPDAFRTPLYPLLMGFFQLTGTGTYGMLFLQLILSSFTAVITYHTAQRILDRRAALIAGLIIALDIPSIVFTGLILTEPVFTFLFAASLYQTVKYIQEKDTRYLSLAALLHALAMLCRPIAVFTFIIFLIGILASVPSLRRKLRNGLLYSFITLLAVSPWLVRNKIVFDSFFLSTAGAHVLHNYHTADILGRKYNVDFGEAQVKLRLHSFENFKGNALAQPVQYADYCRDKALSIIRDNKSTFIRQHAINVFSLACKPVRGYLDNMLGYTHGYQTISGTEFPVSGKTVRIFEELSSKVSYIAVIIQILFLIIIYTGVLLCLWSWRKYNRVIILMLLLLFAYFLNATVPPFTDARLRVPVMPVIAMLSAAGLAKLSRHSSNKAKLIRSQE
jgi:4-amino-4-deoxy-L-arabinose transferase-like glycosyltransferase